MIDLSNPTKVKPSIKKRIVALQNAPENPKNMCSSVCKSQNVCPIQFCYIKNVAQNLWDKFLNFDKTQKNKCYQTKFLKKPNFWQNSIAEKN